MGQMFHTHSDIFINVCEMILFLDLLVQTHSDTRTLVFLFIVM